MSMSAQQLEKMTEFRNKIDNLDEQIIKLLGERFQTCREVAVYKKQESIPMMQEGRILVVKERCRKLAIQHQIDPDFLVNLYSLIIDESCKTEDLIIDSENS